MKETDIEKRTNTEKSQPPEEFHFCRNFSEDLPEEKKSTIAWIFGILLLVIFVLPFSVGVVALSMIADGLALSLLWQWFIVPAFNVPLISITTAIGISLLATVLTLRPDVDEVKLKTKRAVEREEMKKENGEEENTIKNFLLSIVLMLGKPVSAICLGYIVKVFFL